MILLFSFGYLFIYFIILCVRLSFMVNKRAHKINNIFDCRYFRKKVFWRRDQQNEVVGCMDGSAHHVAKNTTITTINNNNNNNNANFKTLEMKEQ